MARDLRQRRVAARIDAPPRRLLHAPGADDQHALCAQVHGRRDRCRLAHRAIAEPLGQSVEHQRLRREEERDGRRRQQVRNRQLGAPRQPLAARPRRQIGAALVEGDVLARAVARRRQRQRMQLARAQHAWQAVEVDDARQQLGQRRVVEQRFRPRAPPARHRPTDRQHRQPTRAAANHTQRIGAVDLLGLEVLPHLHQHLHRRVEVVGMAGERGSVDGAGGSADDDAEGIARTRCVGLAADARNGAQHANLVGGARAASGKNQAGQRSLVHLRRVYRRPAGRPSGLTRRLSRPCRACPCRGPCHACPDRRRHGAHASRSADTTRP